MNEPALEDEASDLMYSIEGALRFSTRPPDRVQNGETPMYTS